MRQYYGGIGGIIGHEISHGFDDQGSQYDGDGNLLDSPGWFTQADLDKFKEKTKALVAQYAAYEPVPGYHVNGELTLGENIADNAGLAICVQGLQALAERQEGAADRRHERRSALFCRLGPGVARQVTHRR